MTRRRVKTGHLPNFRDPSGDWKISGERTHFGKFMTCVTRKKRVSWHVWTTFSYIGYMYIGTTLMVCRNALKDINETWYASCIYRLSTNGLSDYRENPVPINRNGILSKKITFKILNQRLSRACIVHLVIKKNNWSYVKTMSCVILELRST